MFKHLLFAIFLLGISSYSFSIRKKKQIELIESCKLLLKKSVFAGTTFDAVMEFSLRNQEIYYSNKRSKVGFKDFKIFVNGSGYEISHSKRKLKMGSRYNAIRYPYIDIRVQMIERPEIVYSVSIPVHFRGTYTLNFSGSGGYSGSDGDCGAKGCNGTSGRDNGRNGGDGANGEQGSDGYDGNDAQDVKVYVSLVDFERDGSELIRIKAINSSGKERIRYLDPHVGRCKIFVNGGDGGSGGDGGNGGTGGNGGKGAFKQPRTDDSKGCTNEGYGGDGGDGGNGGNGGYGGDGGDAGDVHVFLTEEAEFFKSHLIIENVGGEAGRRGYGGEGGKSGEGGDGGRGNGRNGDCGNSGYSGKSGKSGRSGNVFFYRY